MKKHLGFLLVTLCSFNIFGIGSERQDTYEQEQSILLSAPTEILVPIFLDFISTDGNGNPLEKGEIYQRLSTLFLICKKTKKLLRDQDIKKILYNRKWSKTYGSHCNTPVHCEVLRGNIDNIKALINHGALYNKANNEHLIPLDVAYQKLFFAKKKETRRIFREIVEYLLSLKKAPLCTQTEIYNQYLKVRQKFNFHGDTLLHIAAMTGSVALVDHCLSNYPQISINHKNNYGKTALYYAAENGHRRLVEYLLQRKAVPIIRGGRYNELPGERAQARGHTSISNILFDEEKKWSVKANKNRTFYKKSRSY